MDKELANGSLDSLDSSTDNLEMASSTKPIDTYVPTNTNSAYVEFRDKYAQADNSNQLEPKKNFLKKISNRSTMIISAVILTIVLLISGISAMLVTKNQGNDGSSKLVPSQNLDIDTGSISSQTEIFSGKQKALLVNGDIITRGSLTVTDGSYIGVLKSDGLSSSQEYLLPNSSGTICLSTNNCGFATADQLSSLQSQLGQIIIPSIPEIPASSLVNNQAGSVSIQGASNRISVSTNNGVVSISTPQDIGLLSSPTFANLVLSGNFNIGGVFDLPLNCSINANGGALTTNASGQVICSDDDNTGGGSGTISSPGGTVGYIPIFTAAQTIADSIISQALGAVSVGGDLSLSGDLTLGGLSNGFLSVNGSGLVSVNTIDLGTDTSGDYVLGVSAGNGLSIGGVTGEGWTPTVSLALQSNKGLEVDGNGLSLIDCANGELLKYNGSNQWACSSDIDTDTTGSFTIAGTSGTPETVNNGDTVTIAAGNNVTTTAGATDTVTIATVNNPNFSTSVTTPLLQSSGALSITPGGALTVGSTGQTALLQGTNVTITSNGAGNDIILTSADQIRFSGFDCSALANGGKLTTDASGNISCAADSGASGSAITGSGTANRIALYTGSQVIADSWLLQNGSTLELDNTRNLSLLGGNFSVTGTGLFSGLITANGGLTLGAAQSLTVNGDAFTDLTGTGLSISSGSLQTTLGTSVDLTSEVTGTLPVTSGGTGLASTPTNGQLLIGNGTGYSLATITQGAGITVTNGAGSITVASSLGGTIELGTETTGDYVANVTAGNGLSGSASGAGSTPTLALGQLTADWNQTGAFDIVLNNAGSELRILESSGATFYGALDVGDLTANRTYTLPDATGTICLDTGNCAGSGGGVTTAGGTNNTLAKFNGAQTIADSTITDDGSNVTTSVDLVVQGGSATIGTTLQDGALTLYSSGQSALIQASLGSSDRTYTLPDGDGEFCIRELGNCSGGAGGNAPVGAQYLTLALDGTLTAERTLAFNGTNFSVSDGGANGSYSVNTIQNIDTSATPTFAGLTLNGTLNLGTNTLQGTTAVIDFTNFDVASNGNVTAGTYNGQTISSSASFTGTLTAAGLITANGGITLGAAQSLTVNSDAFTDLTGNGLQVSANTLTIATQSSKGLEVDGNGLSLIDCAIGEILKYNGSNQWACASDIDTDTGVTTVGAIDSQAKSANGAVISGTNIYMQTADASNPGLVSTGTQTFEGDKTFNDAVVVAGLLTGQAGLAISGAAANINTTGTAATSIGNSTGVFSLISSAGNIFNINGATVTDVEFNRLDGKDAALIDINDAVNSAITGTGALSSGSITSGFGTISTANTITTSANISSTGTGTITSAGLLTASTDIQVNGNSLFGNSAGDNIDLIGSLATRRGADYTAAGSADDVNFGGSSLIRMDTSGAAQIITGISGGRDGYLLTLVNADAALSVTLNNNDSASLAANRITTGTGGNLVIPVGGSITLIYDSSSSLWRTIGGDSGACATCANQALSNLSSVNINTALNTTSGDLTLQTTTSGNIVLNGAGIIDLQDNINAAGLISNSAGNVVINDTIDLGSATTGLRVDTSGVVIDIDGNVVIDDQTDIGSATTGIRVATTGSILDIDGDLILNDQVQLGGATGLQITTAGVITDIDGASVQIGENLSVTAGGIDVVGNSTIATTAGNTLSIGNGTGLLTVTSSAGNVFNINGITVDDVEFNRLDGKDAALVDTNDAVATAITGTGALNAGSITSGFGSIDTGADNITTTGTVTAGTLNVNSESFTDLTGNGLQNTANALTLLVQSNKGLEVDGNGLSLIDCANGELLKYNGSNQWACSSDIDTDTGVTTVGAIDSQTKSANGAVISGTSIYLQTADISNPGLVSTGTQTFSGNKTFNNDVEIFGSSINLGNNALDNITAAANFRAQASATGTTGTTTGTGTNTTTLTLTADAFALGDVVLIDNAGQDYYTRITVDPGTGSYTVSPAITFENGVTVTKYNVQNVGATATDYSTLSYRFFQGYFLGGVVTGAGSTTLSDGRLHSTGTLNLNASSALVQNTADSTAAFQIQNAAGTSNLLIADTTNTRIGIGATPANGLLTVGTNTTAITGGIYFGTDTNLYRSDNNTLATDDTFDVGARLTVRQGGGSKTAIQLVSVAVNTGITIGADTNLYRSAADTWTTDDSLIVTGLLTANGDLTLQTGDTFTMNGDALTDLTGSGLTNSGGALTVDNTVLDDTFFQNGGNSFAGAATIGTNDANVLNFETGGTNRFQISSSGAYLTGQGNTQINSSGGFLLIGNSSLSSGVSIGTGNTNADTINIGGAASASPDATYLSLQAISNISLGTSGLGNTIQIGNTTGAVSQTTNIGTNSTASSTNNVNIGSSIAGTTAITGTTTVTGRTSGSATTLNVNNSTSTGNIFVAQDNGTSVMTIADGGAALLQNSVNSTTAFQVQNASSDQLFNINTSTTPNLLSNPSLELNATGWSAKGSATITRDTTQSYVGNASLKIATTATTNDGVNYPYSLTSDTTYTLSFYAKLDSGSAALSTMIVGWSNDGSTDSNCLVVQTVIASGWTRYTCTFTTGTTSGSPYIFIKQSGATARTWYVDSAQLQTGTIGTNIIANPGFEVDTSSWTAYSSAGISRTTGEFNSGVASLQIDSSSSDTGNEGALYYFNNLTPNTQYTFRLYAKLGAGMPATSFGARYHTGSGEVACSGSTPAISSSGWTLWQCSFQSGAAPSSSSYVAFIQTTNLDQVITSYIDDVSVSANIYSPFTLGQMSLNGVVISPLVLQNSADSRTAFQIQNAAGTSNLLIADTINSRIAIGQASASYTLDVGGDINTSSAYKIRGTDICTSSGCTVLATSGIRNQTFSQSNANFNIRSAAAGNIGGVIQGASGQTERLLLFREGTTSADLSAVTSDGSFVANSYATGTNATTSGTGTNTTTVTLTGSAFADNDVVFIDNAGQDYYTRIVSGGGTATLTVSPAVTFETGRTVTKYNTQNIGVNTTNYTAQDSRFFQGYFLGGVVAGAGTTTLSDGRLTSTGTMNINSSSVDIRNTADSTTALRVQNTAGTTLLNADTTNMRISIGSTGTATGQLYVSGTSPTTNAGSVVAGDSGGIVKIQGKYAYTIGFNDGQLHVIDITVPSSPVIVGSLFAPTNVYGLEIKGNYAYAIDPADGLVVFDISNPFSPSVETTISITALGGSGVYDEGFVINGNYLYMLDLGSFPTNFIIIDITNPSNPVVKSIDLPYVNGASMMKAKVQGNYMYISDWSTGQLLIYNMSDPLNPSLESSTSVSGGLADLFPAGRYLYAVRDIGTDSIIAYDVSDPSSPTIAGSLGTGSYNPKGLHVQGRYAYVLFGANRLGIYDISTPGSITQVSLLNGGGLSAPYDFEVQGRYAYVTNASNDTFVSYDLGGAYVQQLEVGGLTTTNLNTDSDANIGNNLAVQNSLSVSGNTSLNGSLGVSGNVTFQNSTNSANAFQIQNSSGHSIFNVDTENSEITIDQAPLFVNGINAPANATLGTSSSGGTLAADTYFYRVMAYNIGGQLSNASAPTPVSVTTTGATSSNTISWDPVDGAAGYMLLKSTDPTGTGWTLSANVGNVLTIVDTGSTPTFTGGTYDAYVAFNYSSTVGVTQGGLLSLSNDGESFISKDTNDGRLWIYNSGGGVEVTGTEFGYRDSTSWGYPFIIDGDGRTTFRPMIDDIYGFQALSSTGDSLFTVDSSNDALWVGNLTPDSTGVSLVLDNKNTAGDPTGTDGAMYYNSSSKSFRCYSNGSWRSCVGGVVFANTSLPGGNTVASTAAETNFASNYTIPANDCQPGRVYKVTAQGVWSNGGGGSNTLRFKAKLGSTTVGDTGANGAAAGVTDESWRMEFNFICQTAGGSGTIEAQGYLTGWDTAVSSLNWAMKNTSTVTIDTTTSQTLQLSVQHDSSSAGKSATLRQFIVEASGP